ncbi:glucose-methanol-choline oxidoreductase-like protein [Mollisia scopiformis]|uniref:Glucose-methanol-choline oxidoreductase-like protein n=1 Tax=Mollisia scopiformis TaxID=149040 RepID=A0A194XJE1_MOLSC|nr:glucose-methanol-choline oxidoreductase-like protein [Mollisia scopiformis]KUJ20239.1 glucose-methanol-choline oxidoreductase-like protein [Mollisia scopiformis]
MFSEFDFIIVGAGASGCVIAARLAQSEKKPSVLLLEAGGKNDDASYRVPADRFALAFREPSLNWGYKTVPQQHLKRQEIDYSRGKGLGGSTAINFSCWVIGPDEDYNEWARKVGDDAWNWTNVKQRLKKIESYHVEVPAEHRKFVNPKAEDHGTTGPIHLSYADPWEKGMADVFEAAQEVGMDVNLDVNSGNPIGMGMGAGCVYDGERTTAADYLKNAPPNLNIMVNSPAAEIIFSGNRATGIRTIDGRAFSARYDVILSLGALNTPQLLMLSGIGPAKELEKHGIPIKIEAPEIGQNLQDHCFSTATLLRNPGTDDRSTFEANSEAARAQYQKDKSGLMRTMYCGVPMGWFKNDRVLASDEFKSLDENIQEHIKKPTVPIFEVATHTPPLYVGDYDLKPTDSYLTALSFVMNPQSTGEVTLNSADPSDAPKVDPNLLSHPFDRRVMIEAMRQTLDYLEAPAFNKSTIKMIGCPKSRSDDDIWDHCAGDLFSSWHMCSTVRMGRRDDKGACVDPDFRLRGAQNLRIVDLSVLPLLPNNHTQSTAYLVGETAAEKMITEYGLAHEGFSQIKL